MLLGSRQNQILHNPGEVCKIWFFFGNESFTKCAFLSADPVNEKEMEQPMNIQKVINNNVISAFDDNNQEVVIMGRGIGFKAHAGDCVDDAKVEKVFRIENETLSRQFQEILANIPLEHMQLTSEIISYAKESLNVQLNQSIYVTLTDHINFAINRYKKGINLNNALLWEIKRFYSQEYELGRYAVNLIRERLDVELPEDEAGFIALHVVNAEYGTEISNAANFPNQVKKMLEIVTEDLGLEMDENSLHYERFVTHLKFLLQRVYRKELLQDEDIEMAEMIRRKYPKEFSCSKKVADYIEKEIGCKLSEEEKMYLAIHIRRVSITEEQEE